jgi:hypothetical protein
MARMGVGATLVVALGLATGGPLTGRASGKVANRLTAVACDQLSDGGHQLGRNFHDRLGPILEGSFILRDRLGLGLLFVVSEDPADPLLVPPWWKVVLSHFLLLRRR